MTFLPDNYKIPESPSNYMKFQDGPNRIRIMSSAVVGWEYFTKDNKSIRSKFPFQQTPDIKSDGKVKPFWAFVVWNYQTNSIQILELVQKTIMTSLKVKIDNRKGNAKGQDFIITKVGDGLDTEYDVDVDEASPIPPEAETAYNAKFCNLEALFTGADPFAKPDPNELVIEPSDLPA